MPFLLLILTFILILVDIWLITVSLRASRPRRPGDRAVYTPRIITEGDPAEVVREVCLSCAENSRSGDIKLDFVSDGSELKMPFDSGKLSAILAALFDHALRLTPSGGSVRVETNTSDTSIAISISAGTPESRPLVLSIEVPAEGATSLTAAMPHTSSTTATRLTPEADSPIIQENQAADSVIAATTEGGVERKPDILLVTADPKNADLLSEGLSADFNVTASAPDAAPPGLPATFHPDVILTDSNLNALPRFESVPLVLLTDKEGDDATVETLTSGADDCITLPIDMAQTIQSIKRLIGPSRNSGRPLICPEPGNSEITPLDGVMLEKAVKYVVTNIRRTDLSVEELSAHLGMSRVHLYKKLKAATGKTPIEFIRLIRMKRGAQMLRERRRNISEIAFQLGYNTPKIFSRYFREEFGVLPSVYQS